ncbi:MAG: DUF2791 family P-loop domain-containing protein [Deltaproteobacteria bacterium]|nr:DUF2791 family P-loop domain-containing protein [Deltaproteobacteria bacterium]
MSGRTEQLALGETPNVAARIQGLAEPNTLLISAATQRLVGSQFECQPFGAHLVKGIETPIAVYYVQGERQYAVPSIGHTTPLVGREQEVGLLRERWEQVKEGRGQVVLLTGEPGIGKSRLTQTLTAHVEAEGSLALAAQCSPYHQNSAFSPLIDTMQRALLFTREDTTDIRIEKLERTLALYDMQETLPLFAALLSLPRPDTAPLLNLTPQKQKERTIAAMVQWWLTQAERQATVSVWEDLHWADPSTLEFLTLLLEQVPTSRLLVLLTARPEFISPWPPRSHFVTLTLNRLGRRQTEAMIAEVMKTTPLPLEITQQILAKTDGVPLFVEELTKSVIESVGAIHESPLQLAIPATLQDSLMARLDRLNAAKEIAQLGATLGREFSYELMQAISPLTDDALQQGLRQLVEAELVYQRGMPPQAQYTFKHALIQDTAYQSLLKSRRQQLHQQIAHVLEERFPETKEAQPELLAHHYTEANLIEQAIPYWQQAGQSAVQRSANQEAISHFTKGLEALKRLPDTPERAQQELMLQIALSPPIMALKGWAAPELDRLNTRAQELCQQIGEVPQLFPVWWNFSSFSLARADYKGAFSLVERCLRFAQNTDDSALLLESHWLLGHLLSFRGDFVLARNHFEKSISLYNPQQHSSHASLYGQDPGTVALVRLGHALWYLGYPDQALKRNQEGFSLSQESAHSFTRSIALGSMTWLYQIRREEKLAQEWADATIAFCVEQELPFLLAGATIWRGSAFAEQGQVEEGIAQINQGIEAYHTAGVRWGRSHYLALLAEAYGKGKQFEKGITALAGGLAMAEETGERWYEAELYRLKGELTLQQERQQATATDAQSLMPDAHGEAEACFLKAIDIARKQQAKSLELRAAMSLARLWQQQGKHHEAHGMLSEIYNWFTEGFDTKDLQEAKALLEELSD